MLPTWIPQQPFKKQDGKKFSTNGLDTFIKFAIASGNFNGLIILCNLSHSNFSISILSISDSCFIYQLWTIVSKWYCFLFWNLFNFKLSSFIGRKLINVELYLFYRFKTFRRRTWETFVPFYVWLEKVDFRNKLWSKHYFTRPHWLRKKNTRTCPA